MKKIRLAHLYPKLLNIYGDGGNILTLKKRCEWRGIGIEIDEINIGDSIKEHDIYFIGGGQDLQQIEVAGELQKHKDFLTSERDNMAVFLGICGGYQLMGHYYQPQNGDKLQGISLLDAYTQAGNKRFIGNVTVQTEFVDPNTLVGFENHSGLHTCREAQSLWEKSLQEMETMELTEQKELVSKTYLGHICTAHFYPKTRNLLIIYWN